MTPEKIRAVWPEMPDPSEWVPFLYETGDQNWHSNFGPLSRRLESEILKMFGTPDEVAIATSSATSALSAALIAHGTKGRVPCPAFTFQATAGAILGAGCEPYIMDVDPVSGTTTPETLAQALDETGAKAAFIVAPYGLTQDFREHAKVCKQRNARLIIDNAAGLGVARGSQIGLDLGAFVDEVYSLHTTKVFGVGEGGLIFTSPKFDQAIRSALNFGLPSHTASGERQKPFWGINGKMSETAAAVGLAVAKTFTQRVKARQNMAAEWIETLKDFPNLAYQTDISTGPWQCFPILMPNKDASLSLIRLMEEKSIELRRYYSPSLGACGGMPSMGECSHAQELSDRAVILPMRSYMPKETRKELMRLVYNGLAQVMAADEHTSSTGN